MANISSFHGGKPLNLWERSCLQSFVDYGHRIALYSYDRTHLPNGVLAADAAEIVSRADFDAYITAFPGAYAQFSDLFRYELLFRRGGWWVDTDVLCLSAKLPDPSFFIARMKEERVNNAIMAFSAGHEFVAAALQFARKATKRTKASRRVFIGPDLISRLVRERGLWPATADGNLCYPFHRQRVFDLVMPEKRDHVAKTVANSPFLHLFQENFRHLGFPRDILPPRGSFLAEKLAQHGADTSVYMDAELCRAFEERELQRRLQLRNRPTGLRKKWRNSIAALSALGQLISARPARKR